MSNVTLSQRRTVTRVVLDGIRVLSGELPFEQFQQAVGAQAQATTAPTEPEKPQTPSHIEVKKLSSVSVKSTANGVTVSSPFNSEFVKAARRLGGKFGGGLWVFDTRLESDVREILKDTYGSDGDSEGDFVRLRIEWKDSEFAGTSPIEAEGRSIARAFGRDSNAKTADGVIVRSGGFTSGGSMKNWGTIAKAETIVELLDFPKPTAERLVSSQPDDERVYSIVGAAMDSAWFDSSQAYDWMTADEEYDAEFTVRRCDGSCVVIGGGL